MEFIDFVELSDDKYRYENKSGSFKKPEDYKAIFNFLSEKLDHLPSNGLTNNLLTQFKALFAILDQLLNDRDITLRDNTAAVLNDLKVILLETVNSFNKIYETALKENIDEPSKNALNIFALSYSKLFSSTFTFFDQYFEQINQHAITLHFMAEKLIETQKVEEYANKVNQLIDERDSAKQELLRYKNSQKNKPAVDLYKDINKDFSDLEKKYRNFFLISIVLTLFLAVAYDPLIGIGGNVESLICSVSKSIMDNCANIDKSSIYPFSSDTLKYIFYKIAVLVVGATLTTYFLRLSSFYQLKQEQAKQTQLELSAFPDYVSGMDESVANILRQELALKYFGKEIDKTLIDKNGDLLQDQIKAGTELIKASAEMVKSVKPSGASDSNEPK
ncbi:hypothetical protein [Acinetobacter venetianus]|uniref:hypothetical protein n=1 Tax=Acinetobacter venetianus TaxID=52133 RepID=UPI00289C7AE8|nr:hypothetical protein [Acinetobacter venetianus]